MRKQTKVVAVASAAALLAIGGAMTSFAAQGWVEEDGTWYYYDKDGNRVEDEWRKSGNNWFWLSVDENGAMATDALIEDDDDTYYVDGNGVMVTNTWVKVVNEDQDDDDLAEYNYYYMQASGKAYKAPDSAITTRFRTIDGKRYAFDDDGKMLYGWVDNSGERLTDEDDWATSGVYYLGSWEDGAMKTGWQKINVHDANEDDDMDYWFWFKSNGKKEAAGTSDKVKEKKINGKKYGFDDRGVMTYLWTIATNSSTNGASASDWKYFNSPEDGARVTKGWFKVVAPDEDNDNVFSNTYGHTTFADKDAGDETERWYYADNNGELAEGVIKKIKGKYYGFRPASASENKAAAMLTGLVLMKTQGEKIIDVLDDDVDADELDDILNGTTTVPAGYTLFYFGNDEDTDGAMKTGNTTVNLGGDSYNFLFSKTGGAEGKGRGATGIDNKYIYMYGCRIKADSDDKYQVVQVVPASGSAVDTSATGVTVTKIKSVDLRNSASFDSFVNDKDESVEIKKLVNNKYYLVNTSGAIQKSKVAAKDGDDWYFYVKNNEVKLYTNNKNLDDRSTPATEKWDSTRFLTGNELSASNPD